MASASRVCCAPSWGCSRSAAGSIAIDGAAIGGLAAHARVKSGLGYVPQGREIFPLLTVEENLKTGLTVLPRPNATSAPRCCGCSRC